MTVYDPVRPREVLATRRATAIEGQWERRPEQRALRPSWLRVLSTLAVLIPGTGRAQILEDWLMLDSSRAFDYLVTERGFGVADSARPDVFRVTASRMLVRHVVETRDRLVASRASAGRVVDGYQRYASSTWLLDVSCTGRTIVVIEKTDYDDDGSVLDRVRPEVRPQDTIGEWDPRPVRLLIDWTCRHRAAGEARRFP